jgi:hypothetical protein
MQSPAERKLPRVPPWHVGTRQCYVVLSTATSTAMLQHGTRVATQHGTERAVGVHGTERALGVHPARHREGWHREGCGGTPRASRPAPPIGTPSGHSR